MIQFANYYCGCGSQPTVLGANTRDEQLGLLWARRTACVVAIVVSHIAMASFGGVRDSDAVCCSLMVRDQDTQGNNP